MARPVWAGNLSFGLVSLPVGLYTATDSHTIHFHQLQRGTSDRIRNRRVNERTGDEGVLTELIAVFMQVRGCSATFPTWLTQRVPRGT
ncbi:Ku protein [Streptomyces goshikiensis]